MKCRIAELNIEIKASDTGTLRFFKAFSADFDKPDIELSVSPFDVKKEMENSPVNNGFAHTESFCLFRKLSAELTRFDGLLLHGAAVSFRDRGIIFSAPSGTGKTTHMLNWKKLYGEELTIINGDKPIVRFINGRPFAFGTPWCGKEGYFENLGASLTDICFIERSDENQICRLTKKQAVELLLQQTLLSSDKNNLVKILDMADELLKKCSFWKIYCTKDINSAKIASEEILKTEVPYEN